MHPNQHYAVLAAGQTAINFLTSITNLVRLFLFMNKVWRTSVSQHVARPTSTTMDARHWTSFTGAADCLEPGSAGYLPIPGVPGHSAGFLASSLLDQSGATEVYRFGSGKCEEKQERENRESNNTYIYGNSSHFCSGHGPHKPQTSRAAPCSRICSAAYPKHERGATDGILRARDVVS